MQWRDAGSIKGSLRDVLSGSEDIKVGFLEEVTLDPSLHKELVRYTKQSGGGGWSSKYRRDDIQSYRDERKKKQYVWQIIRSSILMEHKNMYTERLKRGDKGGKEAAGKGWLYTMLEFSLWPQRIIMYTKISFKYFWESESRGGKKRGGQRIRSKVGSALAAASLMWGSKWGTLRWWPEP